MFQGLHTSLSVVHIKSTVNVQIIKGLLQCYSIVKNIYINFYLTIFTAINANIMNKTKLFTLAVKGRLPCQMTWRFLNVLELFSS